MRNLRLWVALAAAGVCFNQDSAAQSGDVASASARLGVGASVVVETPMQAAGFVKPGNPLLVIPLSSLSTTRDRPLFSSPIHRQWGYSALIGDPAMTLAAIDRIVHHATILEMNVDSYRRKEAIDKARGIGRPSTRATIKASS